MTWVHVFRNQERNESFPGVKSARKQQWSEKGVAWRPASSPSMHLLSLDEWLREHEFGKAGAGLSSRCGLTRSWANLIAHWPHHKLINLDNCYKTNPAKILFPALQAKLSQTQKSSGVQGSTGGRRWGEAGLPSAAASWLVQSVKLARLGQNLLLTTFV